MAIQTIDRGPSFTQSLGTGLTALAEQKIQQHQTRTGLQALGYSPQQANQLSQLSPALLNTIIQSQFRQQAGTTNTGGGKIGQSMNPPSSYGENGLEALQQAETAYPERGMQEEDMQQQDQQQQTREALNQRLGQKQQQENPNKIPIFPTSVGPTQKQQAAAFKPLVNPEKRNPIQQEQTTKEAKLIKKKDKEEEKISDNERILNTNEEKLKKVLSEKLDPLEKKNTLEKLFKIQNKKASIEEDKRIKELNDVLKSQTKLNSVDQRLVDKETLPYAQELNKAAKAAKNNNKRLEKMEQLINSGKLSDPAFFSLINKLREGIFGIGIDLSGSYLNRESQEFEKLTADFLKEARNIFGNRLTNYDVQQFLKTVPNLAQSDEGKKLVINNLKDFNEGELVRRRIMRKIISLNDGKRPSNIEELVDNIAEPELDTIADHFKKLNDLIYLSNR